MTKYLIIEDERFAYTELQRMMKKLRPDYTLAGWAKSVEQAVELLSREGFDFLITDIRLGDGLCFEVFERQPTSVPVIFTTAYDEYAIKAFELNSIDYLLKPVEEADLSDALRKLEQHALVRPNSPQYADLAQNYQSHVHKNRFLIRLGDTYRYVLTADVAYFISEDKTTLLCTLEGKRYIIDYSLDQLEPMLPAAQFFRLSRACIANIKSIGRVSKFFGGRLSVALSPKTASDQLVSRSRVTDFLKWMDE